MRPELKYAKMAAELEFTEFEGLVLTKEEAELARYLRQRKEELAKRRQRDAQQQQQLDLNAVKAIHIKVMPPKPEDKPAASSQPLQESSGAMAAVEKEKEKEKEKEEVKWRGSSQTLSKPSLPVVKKSTERGSEEASSEEISSASVVPATKTKILMPQDKQKYMQKKRKLVPRDELDEAIFPSDGLIPIRDWNPSLKKLESGKDGQSVMLSGFGLETNQTLALKITVPSDSTRYALNLCPPDCPSDWSEILLHMNPRRFKKEELLLNSRTESRWRKADNLPLADLPAFFGSNTRDVSFELIIQVV